MKQYIPLLILFFCLKVSAQIDTIPNPPGYTSTQLGAKSIVRVAPNDHIWVGFSKVGVGEYDGTNWRMYTDTNGLNSNYVTALEFDGNVKWIGTDNGLIKTDGVNLLSFNTFNSPLPSDKINFLYKSDTTLWIATDSGAVSYNGINFIIYNKSNSPLTSDTVLCFNENPFGLYVSDANGVYVLTSNGWKNTSPNISPVFRFTSDLRGGLYYLNNQIRDTIFKKIVVPTNPCEYNKLNTQPYFYLGATSNNKLYSIAEYIQYESLLFDSDSLMEIQNSYSLPFSIFLPFNTDSFKLFDFNNLGELITAPLNVSTKIFRINFSGVVPITEPDSCPFLDVNQVRARIWNNGTMFWDLSGNPLYESPKGSGKSPIFAEGLWIGGKDSQNKLHIAAQTYRQSGSDFWPGPLDTTNATIDPATFQQYDKLWKIDRYTVLTFIHNFQNGNVTNGSYPVPDIILNWPAHGSGNHSRSLAPFVDYNNDGVYNPMDGDYPDIKGDQFFWWVFNDNNATHGETQSPYNLGVEIHGSAYAYNCPQIITGDSVVNYTTFYHYDLINRSDTDYHDVYTGIYNDVDLGNYLDDYVGCDTINDFAFAYNGDDDDNGIKGYGLHPPMINLALLDGPEAAPNDNLDNNHNGAIDEAGENCMMNYFIYWNSDNTAIGNPSTAIQYYWRLQGLWKDSSHIVKWGTGYDLASTDYTNYMFSGPAYDTTGWSENHPCIGCQPSQPSDRRIFVSSGPFNLPAHEKRSIDYAYVFTREPNAPNGTNTSIAVNRDQVMRIKNFFATDSFPCKQLIGVEEIKKDVLSMNLYPNPAHSEINVTLLKNEPGIKTFLVTDVLGKNVIGRTKFMSSTFRIDLTRLSPGIYFLHVQSGDKSSVKRFIVE